MQIRRNVESTEKATRVKVSHWKLVHKAVSLPLTTLFLKNEQRPQSSASQCPKMDVVGSVAALSQLAVYVQCAVRCLRHICETLKTSTSFANSQLEELQVLLEILDRIQRHHSPSDTEDLVPVLISIADTTQVLRNWFEPPKTLRQKLNLIAHQSEIEERFRRLREKYNLLVLYYSERSDRALGRIESSLNARQPVAAESTETMSFPIIKDGSTSIVSLCPFHIPGMILTCRLEHSAVGSIRDSHPI